MNVRKLALPFLVLPFALAACGEDGGGGEAGDLLPADPAYFSGQQFSCGEPGRTPTCPPAVCEVDVNGNVSNCDDGCSTTGAFTNCTAFQFVGPVGINLCVPSQCTVALDGTTECDFNSCAEDDVTCYLMDLFESSCG